MNVVLLGAGKIGRGVVAPIVLQAGHSLTMLDVFENTVHELNKAKSYEVFFVGNKNTNTEKISGFRAEIVGSKEADTAIENADLIFTAVGVNNLKSLFKSILPALETRVRKAPVDVILCENMVGVEEFVREIINEFSHNANETNCNLGIASSSISIAVAPTQDKLNVVRAEYNKIQVNKDGLKTDFDIENIEQISPYDHVIAEKLYVFNMAHAFASYVGYLKDYKTVDEALDDEEISASVYKAMYKVADAMAKKFTLSTEYVCEQVELTKRLINNRNLKDPIVRIATDPVRKLGKNDRLTGAYYFALSEGIVCEELFVAIAAAFLYDNGEDSSALKIQDYVSEHGIEAALSYFTGIMDKHTIDGIIRCYSILSNSVDVEG